MANYRTQHIATVPAGWRVRTKRAGGHLVRIAFPPGRRRKGSGQVVEVLHPNGENGCDVERKNPEQLLIFGMGNPAEGRFVRRSLYHRLSEAAKERGETIKQATTSDGRIVYEYQGRQYTPGQLADKLGVSVSNPKRKNAGGFGNHRPGCPCAFCKRAAKLQSGELKPPKLPNQHATARKHQKRVKKMLAKMPKPIRDVFDRNPKRRNRTGVGPGAWVHTAGRSEVYRVIEMQGAPRAKRYLLEGPYPSKARVWTRTGQVYLASAPNPRKRNPDDSLQAVQLYQTFHGKDPRGIVEKQEPALMREDFAAIGPLEYLTIKSPHGDAYKVEFEGDGVTLASSPDGKQLYCIGGNQNLSSVLARVLDAASLQKDFVDLGECVEVQYLARKVHSNFQPVSWHHKFGEKNGQRPELIYDSIKKRIFFAGGAYYIDTSAEISPGIEN